METISRLDKTQKMYFDMCLKKFTSLMLDEPRLEQQLQLVEFIGGFTALDGIENFNVWYRKNLDKLIEIFFG